MEILGALHHFVEYEATDPSSEPIKAPIFPEVRASALLGVTKMGITGLMIAAGLQQTLVTAMLTQLSGDLNIGSPLTATVGDVPIGDLVEVMVGENSDMAEVVEESEEVEVTINLQQNDGETVVSVEGRYEEDADAIASSSAPTVTAPTVTAPTVTTTSRVVTSNGLLKYGVRGSQVVQLQDRLKTLGYFSANSTGYFGEITEAAVMSFQYDNLLVVDGVVGPQTLGVLLQPVNTQYVVNGYYGPSATNTEYAVLQSAPTRTVIQPLPPQTRVIAMDISAARPASYSAITSTPLSTPPVPAANPATSIDGAEVGTELYIGSEGPIVKDIQTLLQQSGKYSGPITGYFGPLTAKSIENFQRSKGLAPTGIVGKKTLVALSKI